jgi:hypothetical protein
MVKWVQRKETGRQFTAAIDSQGEKRNFLVDVTTGQNRFVNYLELNTNILLPSGNNHTIAMEQIAPGRYVAAFPAEEIGAYYFSVYSSSGEDAAAPRTFGFGIPYTEEFNSTMVNEGLLKDLAATTNGELLSIDNLPADLFKNRSDSKQSATPIWPYLIMVFLLLLMADVAARKFFA